MSINDNVKVKKFSTQEKPVLKVKKEWQKELRKGCLTWGYSFAENNTYYLVELPSNFNVAITANNPVPKSCL